MSASEQGYEVLRSSVGAAVLERDVLRAVGPDAIAFLQGQLSQDVAGLSIGDSAWSLLLQPQGKLDAWLRVTRIADAEVLLDVDPGWGAAVVTRLNRFKIRTKCDLETLVGWRCVAVRGVADAVPQLSAASGNAALAIAVTWPGLVGWDLLGPDAVVPDGIVDCGIDAYETLRIECGVPAMGSELDERTIPAEAGIVEGSVSWTKGCYTGQELVARIDSRGNNVARRLRRLNPEGSVAPVVGAVLVNGAGVEVGRVTSVAEAVGRVGAAALGYVARSVVPPELLVARWDDGEANVWAEELPPRESVNG